MFQNKAVNLGWNGMPFTGADIYYTQRMEAKQIILKLFSWMFVDDWDYSHNEKDYFYN